MWIIVPNLWTKKGEAEQVADRLKGASSGEWSLFSISTAVRVSSLSSIRSHLLPVMLSQKYEISPLTPAGTKYSSEPALHVRHHALHPRSHASVCSCWNLFVDEIYLIPLQKICFGDLPALRVLITRREVKSSCLVANIDQNVRNPCELLMCVGPCRTTACSFFLVTIVGKWETTGLNYQMLVRYYIMFAGTLWWYSSGWWRAVDTNRVGANTKTFFNKCTAATFLFHSLNY